MSIGVFFDTEFTTLDVRGHRALISIGLVSDDAHEFYAELADTWNREMCSSFVIDTVLPLLGGDEYRMPEAQLAIQLKDWIEKLSEEEVVLRSDSPLIDWPWVAELFHFYGCWPKNLRRKCGGVYFRLARHQRRFDAGLESYWNKYGAQQHHALADARSLRFAWKYATRRRM